MFSNSTACCCMSNSRCFCFNRNLLAALRFPSSFRFLSISTSSLALFFLDDDFPPLSDVGTLYLTSLVTGTACEDEGEVDGSIVVDIDDDDGTV